jgi:hypothetical protein
MGTTLNEWNSLDGSRIRGSIGILSMYSADATNEHTRVHKQVQKSTSILYGNMSDFLG